MKQGGGRGAIGSEGEQKKFSGMMPVTRRGNARRLKLVSKKHGNTKGGKRKVKWGEKREWKNSVKAIFHDGGNWGRKVGEFHKRITREGTRGE